jgi:RNA polymerase sigma factor (sigma-70 family)
MAAYRQRASFSGEVPVDAWLHRIAVNSALTSLRRRRVRWAEPLDAERHDRSVSAMDPIGGVDLGRALLRLEPRARAAVVLRYYVDLDYTSIAAILDTSPGNVGSMLTRALGRLRQDLGPDETAVVVTVTEEAGHGR